MNPRDPRGLYVSHYRGRRYLCANAGASCGKSRGVIYSDGSGMWYATPADDSDATRTRWPDRSMRRGESARVLAAVAKARRP